MDELLLAAEYILNDGNPNVMLCERGIRTFETHTRFTLPLATSRTCTTRRTCRWSSIPATARATRTWCPTWRWPRVAAGADGLILEVHPDPENALSDGYQSLTFSQFDDLMTRCAKVAEAVGKQM